MMRTLCCATSHGACVLLASTFVVKLPQPVNSSRNVLVFNVHHVPLISIAYGECAIGSNARRTVFSKLTIPIIAYADATTRGAPLTSNSAARQDN
ncbi:hypothetical protein BDR07DRAFT_1419255 [Suillus spraguei]|nr:hypothetical protein BDR07DRAFT_1419255 [Suillus spraguei]